MYSKIEYIIFYYITVFYSTTISFNLTPLHSNSLYFFISIIPIIIYYIILVYSCFALMGRISVWHN